MRNKALPFVQPGLGSGSGAASVSGPLHHHSEYIQPGSAEAY